MSRLTPSVHNTLNFGAQSRDDPGRITVTGEAGGGEPLPASRPLEFARTTKRRTERENTGTAIHSYRLEHRSDSPPFRQKGHALWRTLNIGDLRVRTVEYSPGYLANHWCDRGHILYVLEGELDTELKRTVAPSSSLRA